MFHLSVVSNLLTLAVEFQFRRMENYRMSVQEREWAETLTDPQRRQEAIERAEYFDGESYGFMEARDGVLDVVEAMGVNYEQILQVARS